MKTEYHQEKRIEDRALRDRYYSVEFLLKDTGVYKFKLRDMSAQGLCILVKEDSAVLQHLKVGDTLDIQYNPPQAKGTPETFKTRIRHITPKEQDKTGGHFLIGLEIITS
jgi:hypothetical protein